jgi:hypothetical protein
MDRIRTLLLARTHTVVLDPDRVASAATRPTRDVDLDKLEDELAQLGYVMSLDLALTLRRLPFMAIQELRDWMVTTLAEPLGAHRPHVPLFRSFPAGTPDDTRALYLRRVLTWLHTAPAQPCPWCGEVKTVAALNPCGHLVCRACWDGGNYAGCPICHRRVAQGDPFVLPLAKSGERTIERVGGHDGTLTLVHLGFDLRGTARARFERLLGRRTPLSPDDRAEVEAVIDTLGPKVVGWLPARIPIKETLALAIARLWLAAPDRSAIVAATAAHLRTATDVLRVAVVLLGGDPGLVEPMKLRSIPRALRRAILEALDRLPVGDVARDVRRHVALWKRVGERLHPFEEAERLPNAALAFAVARGTELASATFAEAVRARAAEGGLIETRGRPCAIAWAGPVEDALRARDPVRAIERLAERPGELLRRADHLLRVAQHDGDALAAVTAAIARAMPRGAPAMLLVLAAHLARRGTAWPRRVFFPKADVLRAWGTPDRRAPLRADAIGAVVAAARVELCARAAKRRHFPRAVIDRALGDLLVPIGERNAAPAKLAWPRGSEIAMPDGGTLRLFLHWEEPPQRRVDLDLSVAMYDASWRHVATCDFTNLVVEHRDARAAIHSGDLTSAPAPLGASEFVDLHVEPLYELGARHLVMVVFSYNAVPFDKLPHGFAGIMARPPDERAFDPRAVVQRFDLRGRSVVTIPLAIDLAERRLRWLDVHVASRDDFHQVGGYRAALAHAARDWDDFASTHARPTLWDVACIHAAARANVVHVRERDGSVTTYRRRHGETTPARLQRLLSGSADDDRAAAIAPSDGPTWIALVEGDVPLAAGSTGYALDGRALAAHVERIAAADLVAELAPR